jgi:hypothetical protein
MVLYEITDSDIKQLERTTFAEQGFKERYDLQRLLRDHISAISPEIYVFAEEFGNWEDSKRRIDLRCIDKDANQVVVELKRTEDGGHMDLQAIRYAAMVSTLTYEDVLTAHREYLKEHVQDGQADPAVGILNFLGWEEIDEEHFAQDVRIVLVSAEFSKELTTAVLWLNERDLNIRCVKLCPYKLDNDRVMLDVQQVIPLPEEEEYWIKARQKAAEQRLSRKFNFDFSVYDLTINGTTEKRLRARRLIYTAVKAAVHSGITPEQIAELLPRGMSRWLVVDGKCSADEFENRAALLKAPLGGHYQLSRYFCDDDELFKVSGKTYALINQWSHRTALLGLEQIMAKYPVLQMSYKKCEDEAKQT